MVKAVRAVIDASWIPEDLRGKASWFGLYDFWTYEDEKGETECEYCKTYAGEIFDGNQLRSVFPDLTIISEDLILPNVHWTLWHTDTCKCQLKRVPYELLPEGWTVYSGERTPHYVKPEDRESYYSYKKVSRSIEE